MHVMLFSLEAWDDVWRRNQHLVANLVSSSLVDTVTFVEPPLLRRRCETWSPVAGVQVVRPWMAVPKRLGGYRFAVRDLLRRSEPVDVVWVNDPAFGVHATRAAPRSVYDVTDDWRSFSFPPRVLRRLVRAETALASSAATVVCSDTLRDRWRQRYGVEPAVVRNGVDEAVWSAASARSLPGRGPHVGYVGTLHPDRLDVDLVRAVARDGRVGTLHLVGPDALDDASRARLAAEPNVRLHGPVPAAEVPSWLLAMDVLVSPHLLNDFTASLDAIKAREYVVSGRPVVATPTSGFDLLPDGAACLAVGETFVERVVEALEAPPLRRGIEVPPEWTWAARARQFHAALAGPPLNDPRGRIPAERRQT